MAPSLLERAKCDRDSLITSVSWIHEQLTDSMEPEEIDSLISQVEGIWINVIDNQKKIVACSPENIHDLNDTYKQLLTTLKTAKCYLVRSKPKPIPVQNSFPSSSSTPTIIIPKMKLPTLQLPKFSGNLSDWMTFRDLYVTTIHENHSLSNAQKFSYLQMSLSGIASNLIKSIPLTDANYEIAWDLLQNRFENKPELFFSIMRKFINRPAVQSESAYNIRALIDAANECTRSLQAIDITEPQFDILMTYFVVEKLDTTSRQFWELSLSDSTIPKVENILKFLEQRARSLAASNNCKLFTTQVKPQNELNQQTQAAVIPSATKPSNLKCKFCFQPHLHFQCPTLQNMTVSKRRDESKKHRLCFNCLKEGHGATGCQSEKVCSICKQKHHTMLHPEQTIQTNPIPKTIAAHASIDWNKTCTVLTTALIQIKNSNGSFTPARAFIDSGSTHSFITDSLVAKLGLERQHDDSEVLGLSSQPIGRTKGKGSIIIKPHFESHHKWSMTLDTFILQKLMSDLPSQPLQKDNWHHLNNLQLADPTFHIPSPVDVIIGADVFFDILLNGKKNGHHNSPSALKSKLGWLIIGKAKLPSIAIRANYSSLDVALQKFWQLDEIPCETIISPEETKWEEHFAKTHSRTPEGRNVVQLPINQSPNFIGESKKIALSRLFQIERKLKSNHSLATMYNDFMTEYESLGHMKEITPMSQLYPKCYIPHHFVLKDINRPDKFRVVFDASARTSSGKSLNDIQLAGPIIQDTMSKIIMRFRTHPIGFTADISKMFRQIQIHAEHRYLQCIVWRSNPALRIKEFALPTVTYGTKSAPFLAQRVLKQLAHDEQQNSPLAYNVLQNDFYIDDLQSGAESNSEAIDIINQVSQALNSAGMTLRKWASNSLVVTQHISTEMRDENCIIPVDEKNHLVKALGLHWNTKIDAYQFKV